MGPGLYSTSWVIVYHCRDEGGRNRCKHYGTNPIDGAVRWILEGNIRTDLSIE